MNQLLQHEQTQIRNGSQFLFGGFAQQNPRALLSFNRLLNAHSFDTIIELGTHTGGFSLFFALYCYMSRRPAYCDDSHEPSLFVNRSHHRNPKRFFTFDIVERDKTAIDAISHLGGFFYQYDTLHNEHNIEWIRNLIRGGGPTLVLCDGGNKKRELELYGSSLKSGDFICLHDWARDEAAFARNKALGIWNGWETRWEDGQGEGQQFGIRELCQRYYIEQVYAEEFDDSVWFCGRKV